MTTKRRRAAKEEGNQITPPAPEEKEQGGTLAPQNEGSDALADLQEGVSWMQAQVDGQEGSETSSIALIKAFLSDTNLEMFSHIPEQVIPDLIDIISLGIKYKSRELLREAGLYLKLSLSVKGRKLFLLGKIAGAERERELIQEAQDLR